MLSQASHPVRGAWIEIVNLPLFLCLYRLSHPVRGAWIEIANSSHVLLLPIVAPRQGCVD